MLYHDQKGGGYKKDSGESAKGRALHVFRLGLRGCFDAIAVMFAVSPSSDKIGLC